MFWNNQNGRSREWALDHLLGSDLTETEIKLLAALVAVVGKRMLREGRCPVPIHRLADQLLQEVGLNRVLAEPEALCDAVKTLLSAAVDPTLRILAPTQLATVGYLVDITDQETWPIGTRF